MRYLLPIVLGGIFAFCQPEKPVDVSPPVEQTPIEAKQRGKQEEKYFVTDPFGYRIWIEVTRDPETGEIYEAYYDDMVFGERFRLVDEDCSGGPDKVVVFPELGDLEGGPMEVVFGEDEFRGYLKKVDGNCISYNRARNDTIEVFRAHEVEVKLETPEGAVTRKCIVRRYKNRTHPYDSVDMTVLRYKEDGMVHMVDIGVNIVVLKDGEIDHIGELFSIENLDGKDGFDKVVIRGYYNNQSAKYEEINAMMHGEDGFSRYLDTTRSLVGSSESPGNDRTFGP